MIQEHKERFAKLLQRDHTNLADKERRSLFYIISGNEDLFSMVNYLYDFEERCINPEVLDGNEVFFSSGAKALIKLGFNLYNGYPADMCGCLSFLDEENLNLAIEAIKVRFL